MLWPQSRTQCPLITEITDLCFGDYSVGNEQAFCFQLTTLALKLTIFTTTAGNANAVACQKTPPPTELQIPATVTTLQTSNAKFPTEIKAQYKFASYSYQLWMKDSSDTATVWSDLTHQQIFGKVQQFLRWSEERCASCMMHKWMLPIFLLKLKYSTCLQVTAIDFEQRFFQ